MMALCVSAVFLGYIIPFVFDRPRPIRPRTPARIRNEETTTRFILKEKLITDVTLLVSWIAPQDFLYPIDRQRLGFAELAADRRRLQQRVVDGFLGRFERGLE
jgi:hypothetical protein